MHLSTEVRASQEPPTSSDPVPDSWDLIISSGNEQASPATDGANTARRDITGSFRGCNIEALEVHTKMGGAGHLGPRGRPVARGSPADERHFNTSLRPYLIYGVYDKMQRRHP